MSSVANCRPKIVDCHVFIIEELFNRINGVVEISGRSSPQRPFQVMFLCAKKMRTRTGVRRIIRRLVVLVVGCLRLRLVLLFLPIGVGIVAASHKINQQVAEVINPNQ